MPNRLFTAINYTNEISVFSIYGILILLCIITIFALVIFITDPDWIPTYFWQILIGIFIITFISLVLFFLIYLITRFIRFLGAPVLIITFQRGSFKSFFESFSQNKKNNPFYLDFLKPPRDLINGITYETKDGGLTYFLSNFESLGKSGKFDYFDKEGYFPHFLNKNFFTFDKYPLYSVIMPIGYTIESRGAHAILCILEKINRSYNVYIINSHAAKYFNERTEIGISVKNFIKTQMENLGIQAQYHLLGCGTQSDISQCIKYVAKLIYNYMLSRNPFSKMRYAICPGYTKEENLALEKEAETGARKSQVIADGKIYQHLTKEDIIRLENLSGKHTATERSPLNFSSNLRKRARKVFGNNYVENYDELY